MICYALRVYINITNTGVWCGPFKHTHTKKQADLAIKARDCVAVRHNTNTSTNITQANNITDCVLLKIVKFDFRNDHSWCLDFGKMSSSWRIPTENVIYVIIIFIQERMNSMNFIQKLSARWSFLNTFYERLRMCTVHTHCEWERSRKRYHAERASTILYV